MGKPKTFTWKDPRKLTTAVIAVMAFDAFWAAGGLAIWTSWGPRADFANQASDTFTLPQFVGWLHAVLALPVLLLLLVPLFWILRVSRNAHVLARRTLRNSPIFAALWWYVIPFMSLFKPVESLGEIWDVSAADSAIRKRGRVALPIWWGATIIGNGASILSGQMGKPPVFEILYFAVSVVQCLAFIVVAHRICAMQVQKRLVSEFSDAEEKPDILQALTA